MSDDNFSSLPATEKKYTPFTAILIILVALIVVYGLQFRTIINQRSMIKNANVELSNVMPQAEALNNTMVAISQDLLAMAPTNQSARQIITEFRIQAVQNPNAPAQQQAAPAPASE
ncbi:hypothetical protein QPK87_27525 [Kamptonema cortianum]|nr:hypothetical protein [Oscillatoria laete-virens]MDK3160281.1 hypothetical protein [Kamptonema cortianum]MDL5053666.1 hypothetical protein [Oscillatoria laete-virens NRMC-F 0139]